MWLERRRTLDALACIEAEPLKTGHNKSRELVLRHGLRSRVVDEVEMLETRRDCPRVAAMAATGIGWRGNRYRSARCPRPLNQGLSLVNQGLSLRDDVRRILPA